MIGVTPKDGKTAEWIGEPIGVADVLVGIKRRKLTAQQATNSLEGNGTGPMVN